jgi:hypothetical protein
LVTSMSNNDGCLIRRRNCLLFARNLVTSYKRKERLTLRQELGHLLYE